MDKSPDVVVVGLGVQGAAAAYELARRGLRVLGIDALAPPHGSGSSHGRTRIIREAYYEHPLYVPLVQRAFDVWLELEELTGAYLYRRTGGLNAGPLNGALVQGALQSVREHDLEHEVLDAAEMRHRFPAVNPRPDDIGVFEPRAGILMAEACVRTMLDLARGYGAELRTGCAVRSWSVSGDDVILDTGDATLRAPCVVFAAGSWLNGLLSRQRTDIPLKLPLSVERQTTHWYRPPPETHAFRAANCPITLLEYAGGRYFYTIPDIGHGLKAGIHHEGPLFDPDDPARDVTAVDEERVATILDEWMPGAANDPIAGTVCLYTNTPDAHFIVDRHPTSDRVIMLSACSGHGFKFAPALGEIVADLVIDGESVWDITPFRVERGYETVSQG